MTQADDLRDRLRRALPAAMKARDRPAITALRSALAAIDNAEAYDPDEALAEGTTDLLEPAGWEPADPDDADVAPADRGHSAEAGRPAEAGNTAQPGHVVQAGLAGPAAFAGTVAGVGATEVERRGLTPKQVEGIVRAEIETLEVAADVLDGVGKHEHAEQLRAQMRALLAHVNETPSDTDAGPSA
jgi:uncharacterized protein